MTHWNIRAKLIECGRERQLAISEFDPLVEVFLQTGDLLLIRMVEDEQRGEQNCADSERNLGECGQGLTRYGWKFSVIFCGIILV